MLYLGYDDGEYCVNSATLDSVLMKCHVCFAESEELISRDLTAIRSQLLF